MGYRSETAFVVEFVDEEGRDKVLGMLTEDERAYVLDAVEVDGRSVRFHETAIKWYATSSIGVVVEGFADIDALERFLDLAQEFSDDGIPNVGAFARVGEDYDTGDIETRYWGFDVSADIGLSEPFSLLGVRCSIWIGDAH